VRGKVHEPSGPPPLALLADLFTLRGPHDRGRDESFGGTGISEGFRVIADYIFGNNSSAQESADNRSFTEQGSEKIAMTAPVTQQGNGNT
jgi:hypothetical protein